jgi:hypothetical protein
LTVKEALSGVRVSTKRKGNREGPWGVKRIKVCYVYAWRQHKETHQILFLKRGDGVNRGKVYYIHLWNFHMNLPHTINECQI